MEQAAKRSQNTSVNNPGIREKVVFTMGKAMLIDLKNRLDDANMSVFTV